MFLLTLPDSWIAQTMSGLIIVGIGEGLASSVRVLLEVLAKDAGNAVFPFNGSGLVDV